MKKSPAMPGFFMLRRWNWQSDAGLDAVQVGVDAVLRHELIMGALFDDAISRQNQDAVGVADGRQAVGDDQGGSAVRQAEQCLLYRPFALVVERAGRFVEDQDLRIL